LAHKSSREMPVEEAISIIQAANDDKVTLRLIGGMAVRFHCHGPHSSHVRTYHDIDIFGLSKERADIHSIFQKLGYTPNNRYNVLYGASRLQFFNPSNKGHVDVYLNKFIMDHTIDFRTRLHIDKVTISVTDLLLTKLQIVRFTEKDSIDTIAILEDPVTGQKDGQETLNLEYIARLCSKDWGLYKTITLNLHKMREIIEKGSFKPAEKEVLAGKIEAIQKAVEIKEKTLRWKLSALLGEKIKWYEKIEIGEGEM
jgi:hypothetical protein